MILRQQISLCAVFFLLSVDGLSATCPASLVQLLRLVPEEAALQDLLDSHYAGEAQNLDQTAKWVQGHNANAFFDSLQKSIEMLIDSKGFSKVDPLKRVATKRLLFEQALAACSQPMDPVTRDFLWEWLESSHYPRIGVPPTRREVIARIHSFVRTGLSAKNRKDLFVYLVESGNLVVSGPGRNLDKLIRRTFDESNIAQGFFQRLVFFLDLSLARVLPLSSYNANALTFSDRFKFLQRLVAGGNETETRYRTKGEIRHELKLLDFMISWRLLKGVDPAVKEVLYSGVAHALAGHTYFAPRSSDLKKSFVSFVEQQTRTILLQRSQELGVLLPAVAPIESVATADNQIQVETAPVADSSTEAPVSNDNDILAAPDAEEPELLQPTLLVSEAIPSEVFEVIAPRELEEAQQVYSVKPNRTPKKIRREKPEIQSATIPELTWGMAKALIGRFTPTRSHYVRVMASLTELQKDYSESRFERELQSICAYLQVLENQDRFKPAELGRHLKKLVQPHLWEIKPQGRSQARLILAATKEGLVVLDLLLDTKNNEKALARKLNDLSDEAKGIRDFHNR